MRDYQRRYDAGAPQTQTDTARLGRLACHSLYQEVALALKPGLVGPDDAGSHADMDFRSFLRSIQSLRGYFPQIAQAGASNAPFTELQSLGIAAEQRMLAATGGVNTHRGAIFNLGLLCAAAGRLSASGHTLTAERVCHIVSREWGNAIQASAPASIHSHGSVVTQRYHVGGARAEATGGFTTARTVGLASYQQALADLHDSTLAAHQALFTLIASTDDTNLLWRGGLDGLRFAQARAQAFLANGGVYAPDWRDQAREMHAAFVTRRLSPGGSADLLAVTLFLHGLSQGNPCA